MRSVSQIMGFGLVLMAAVDSAQGSSTSRYMSAKRQIAVTEQEVAEFDWYAEYTAATYCNYDTPVGSLIECTENACPRVTEAGATIFAQLQGDITDLTGFVAIDDTNQQIVVAYKGSTTLRNWITDFVFLQTPCDLVSGCLVHLGFKTAHDETYDAMITALGEASELHPGYKIVFVGHSLGAAVATLSAAYARVEGYDVALYNFGCPRVGNEAFVAFVTEQAGVEYRITHVNDPTPRLPPIVFNYRHTSPEYWFYTGTATTVDYTADDAQVCEGYANIECNGGTLGLNGDAHNFYFQEQNVCGDESLLGKRFSDVPASLRPRGVTKDMATTEPKNVTDAELLAQMDEWAAMDAEFVANMKKI